MVRAIGSASEFDALIGSKKPVLVKFCAAWCGSCRRFVPAFDALATQYPGVEFVTVDVDGVQEVFNAQFAGCSRVSLPSFKHFKGGAEVGNFVSGANEAEIRKRGGVPKKKKSPKPKSPKDQRAADLRQALGVSTEDLLAPNPAAPAAVSTSVQSSARRGSRESTERTPPKKSLLGFGW